MASATRNKTNLSVRPTGILVLTWSGLCRMQVGSNAVESNTNGVGTWYHLVPGTVIWFGRQNSSRVCLNLSTQSYVITVQPVCCSATKKEGFPDMSGI